MLELLSGLAVGAAAAGLLRSARRAQADFDAACAALSRARIVEDEARRLHRAERRLLAAQQVTEGAVAVGADVVRVVHRGIAAIPFTILENIPVTRHTSRVVRRAHDLISDAVYDTIGAVNRGVGSSLRSGLRPPAPDRPEPPTSAVAAPPALPPAPSAAVPDAAAPPPPASPETGD